jgi:Glucose / Sorbosone dehydrogenase
MRRFSYRLVQYFVLFLVTSDIGHSLPDGFIKDLVAYVPPSVLKDTVITAATVAPYPQSLNKNLSTSPSSALVFLASKDGKIIVVDIPNSKLAFPPSSNFTMMLDWEPRVCHDGTRWGIHSMTVHPKFSTTHPYLYIMYSSRNADNICWDKTLRSAAVNHVSRATVNFRPWKLTSELTLLELSSTQQSFISSKTPQEGTISFGKDGMLYVATTSYDANSTLDRTPFLQGTILRIHDDGRIPRDNPNVSPLRAAPPCGKNIPSKPSKNCPEMYVTSFIILFLIKYMS